jgi:hypothetical protein
MKRKRKRKKKRKRRRKKRSFHVFKILISFAWRAREKHKSFKRTCFVAEILTSPPEK